MAQITSPPFLEDYTAWLDLTLAQLKQQKSKLSLTIFPESCPYSIEQILDFGWLP